jgi:hypothetical protein
MSACASSQQSLAAAPQLAVARHRMSPISISRRAQKHRRLAKNQRAKTFV